jgi:hypothetical protein
LTMSSGWRVAYESLTNFTAAHPEIRIDESRVSIPDGVRGEFYRLYDSITEAFVQENESALPGKEITLAERYKQIEREVFDLLGLDGVAMPASLDIFLHNPKQGLTRALFDRLFDLLQGKVDLEIFEQQALKQLDKTVTELGRWGYPYWVSLSLVRLLDPDEAFQVALDSQTRPILKELKNIPFGHPPPHPTLRLPDFIVHSRRINKYLALKLELASEIGTYTTDNRGERKQAMRNCGDTSSGLGPRVMLIYVVARPEEIPIVADLNTCQVAHPDIVVECQAQEAAAWDEAMLHYDVLQPKLGTYIVLRETALETNLQSPSANLNPLAVGLDQAKLQLVIEALVSRPS